MRASSFRIARILGFFSPIFFLNPVFPQDSLRHKDIGSGIDSLYIGDYTNLLTARLYLLYQDANFVFIREAKEQIVFKPNVNVRIGIAGFYKWFGLGLTIKNPIFEKDPDKYGKTTSLDLRINAYGNQFAAELYFQNYKGYYISNPAANDGSLFKVPGMKLLSIGFTGYWIYNYKRFSIRASVIQNELQKKSAGSLIISPFFSYYNIQSPDGIVPPELIISHQIKNYDNLKSGDFYSFGLAPGYAYSFVFLKNFYITGALSPGVYWGHSSYITFMETKTTLAFSFFLNGRLVAGYNSKNWYIGASIITGFNDIPSVYAGSKFYYEVAQMRFWAGTRFDWFRKKTKKK